MRHRAIRLCGSIVCTVLLFAGIAQAQPTLPEVDVEAPRIPSAAPQVIPPGTFTPTFTPPSTPSGTPSAGEATTDRTLVGSYQQPAWTTDRPFASTRSYVLPAGQVEFEQWVRPKWPMHGKPETQFLEEIAVGLPGRFQLDVYERWDVDPNDLDKERAVQEGVSLEGRWAFADWGVIPLNPTIYAEWLQGSRAEPDKFDRYEFKLLLADEILPNLYYAANGTFEQETGGIREQEIAFSQAFSSTVIDRKLLAGIEMLVESKSVQGDRAHPQVAVEIGPSVQWKPTKRTFLDVVPLFGVNRDSPRVEMFVIFGIQFSNPAGPSEGGISGPASTRGL